MSPPNVGHAMAELAKSCGVHVRTVRAGVALLVTLLSAAALAAANKLPVVTLTAPSNGASFAAPAAITLAASASDPDGTVAKVDFYQGSTLIGTRTASPYTLTWSNVPGGTYTLTARATDNRGGTRTSTAASITVTGPKVLILSPASGAAVYGASVAVNGAFYGDANTTVLVDNGNTTRVASVDGNTYTATIPVHYGPNALRVVATRRDRTSDTSTVTVTGHGNPLLVFAEPATTLFDAPANIDLTIDAMSPAGTIGRVDFYRSGTLLGTASAPPYRYAWNNVGAGSYTVSAIATDALGATGTTSLAITVNGPNVPPTVSLTAPAGGASFLAPASIPMAASATDADGSVTLVEFLQNGIVVGTTNVAPYGITWSDVPAGSYALAARATDNRTGITTSVPVNVIVSPPNIPPTVALTSPAAGATFVAPAAISLTAAASDGDGTITKVEYFAGSTLVGTATAAPYNVTWTGVASGTYVLSARAHDNVGAIATSAPVSVTVDPNSAPTVNLTSPASGASYYAPVTITIAASAADTDGTIERVEFFEGSNLIGTATTAPFTYVWTQVPAGSYTFTARARDDVGAVTTSAPVSVSVLASAMTITSPANAATIAGDRVTVSGAVQAPANSGVTVNGVVAAIDSTGHFHATGVPLVPGANTLGVTLTTLAGYSASQSINLTSTGPGPVRIEASPTQGLAPLEVVFAVAPIGETTIAIVEVDADGDGNFERTLLAAPWTTSVTYGGSGTAMATVRVTDEAGVVSTETIPIVLIASAALDANLRAVWNGMKTALASGDKAAAMRYLDASAQQKYAPVFDALLPSMPQIVASFSEPHSVMLSGGLGEYAINRIINGENRIFFVYFGRNGDGVWRLGSM